jgi:hypothetical protein
VIPTKNTEKPNFSPVLVRERMPKTNFPSFRGNNSTITVAITPHTLSAFIDIPAFGITDKPFV